MDRFPSYVAGVSVEQGVVDRVVAGYVAGFQPDSVERERETQHLRIKREIAHVQRNVHGDSRAET